MRNLRIRNILCILFVLCTYSSAQNRVVENPLYDVEKGRIYIQKIEMSDENTLLHCHVYSGGWGESVISSQLYIEGESGKKYYLLGCTGLDVDRRFTTRSDTKAEEPKKVVFRFEPLDTQEKIFHIFDIVEPGSPIALTKNVYTYIPESVKPFTCRIEGEVIDLPEVKYIFLNQGTNTPSREPAYIPVVDGKFVIERNFNFVERWSLDIRTNPVSGKRDGINCPGWTFYSEPGTLNVKIRPEHCSYDSILYFGNITTQAVIKYEKAHDLLGSDSLLIKRVRELCSYDEDKNCFNKISFHTDKWKTEVCEGSVRPESLEKINSLKVLFDKTESSKTKDSIALRVRIILSDERYFRFKGYSVSLKALTEYGKNEVRKIQPLVSESLGKSEYYMDSIYIEFAKKEQAPGFYIDEMVQLREEIKKADARYADARLDFLKADTSITNLELLLLDISNIMGEYPGMSRGDNWWGGYDSGFYTTFTKEDVDLRLAKLAELFEKVYQPQYPDHPWTKWIEGRLEWHYDEVENAAQFLDYCSTLDLTENGDSKFVYEKQQEIKNGANNKNTNLEKYKKFERDIEEVVGTRNETSIRILKTFNDTYAKQYPNHPITNQIKRQIKVATHELNPNRWRRTFFLINFESVMYVIASMLESDSEE